ncbi:acyltransferase [uncultured Methanolobus sp.]|uniref:acyltransferase n=1 Tax=uncultured Methanolobus sp. TaxID=218300 RepID=UPI0029C78DBC|nr:acyltransferase [uncultured Methanolobus sp.]
MLNRFVRQRQYIGMKNIITYFFFQRLLRINSHVPWPVHFSSIVKCPENIKMKYWRPYLGYSPGCYIQAMNGIEIGVNVRIGPGIKIISANHDIYNFDKHTRDSPIIIGDNCWIGANAVILPGVKLGNHVIVGAGSVVTKSFSSNCIIGGVPAKLIKQIDDYSVKSDW